MRSVVRRAAIALGVAAIVIFALATGRAADLRVVLVGSSKEEPTVERVRQELVLLGLEVEVISKAAGADLATIARERGAAAVARVESSPPEIVLWVDEEHSAGLPQESRVSESVKAGADPGLLALRAIELLRGRLLPVGAVLPPASSAAPSVAAAPSAAPSVAVSAVPSTSATAAPPASSATRPVSRIGLYVGPALVVSPGGVPVMPAFRAGVSYRIIGPLEADGLATIPLTEGQVSAANGRIDLRVLAFGGGLSARFSEVAPRLSLRAGAGLGVIGFIFQGRAEAPYPAASGDRWSALPYAGAGAGVRLTPVLSLRADVHAALSLPPAALRIAGQQVASFGLPILLVSLALEVTP